MLITFCESASHNAAWFATVLCFGLSAQGLQAQNGSLFHRPVSMVSQPANMQGPTSTQGNGEILPTPIQQNNAGQLRNPNPTNSNPGPLQANSMSMQPGLASYPMDQPQPLGLQTSWSYVPPIQARTLKLHDIVSIRVDEISTSLATGSATSRKTTSYDAVLQSWIRLVGLDTIKPAVQANGDPRVLLNQIEVYRGDSNLRTSETLTTNIAAKIVDIKPNGHIVLDATKEIEHNDNSWRFSLTGTCRSQDIDANNVILSRNLIDSRISKVDLGHVRDGYSRGWLTKLVARLKPF